MEEEMKKGAVEVSSLKTDDIVGMASILMQHVRDRFTGEIIMDEIIDIIGWMLGAEDESRKDKRRYLVAKDVDGKVLGCIAWSSPDPEMLAYFGTEAGEAAEALNFFVDKEHQHEGIGRKLFEAMCGSARDEGRKQLVANSGPRYKESWEKVHDKLFGKENRGGLMVAKYGPGGDAMTWKINL